MLPSTSARIVAIFGLICGCLAVYLAEWDPADGAGYIWRALAITSVIALLSLRALGGRRIDSNALASRVSPSDLSRMVTIRRLALIPLVASVVLGVMLAPFVALNDVRHVILIAALALLLIAIAMFAWVEVKFRKAVSRAGL